MTLHEIEKTKKQAIECMVKLRLERETQLYNRHRRDGDFDIVEELRTLKIQHNAVVTVIHNF